MMWHMYGLIDCLYVDEEYCIVLGSFSFCILCDDAKRHGTVMPKITVNVKTSGNLCFYRIE